MKESWLDRYPPVDKDGELSASDLHAEANPALLAVESRIDLHGLRLEEALAATRRYIDECVAFGYRKVVVIHGKGEGGNGVLRREVRMLLERDPRVGRMGYSRGTEGGTGALWLILRKLGGPSTAPGR